MDNISDAELMRRTAAGDSASAGEIVRRHQAFVWGVACRFSGDPAAAEDIAQESFIKLLRAASRYRPTAHLRTYLYRIVSRTCIDHTRKKRPSLLEEPAEIADSAPGPAAMMRTGERQAAVRQGIDKLPPKQRLALILKYYEDASYADMAQALDITEKAVERLLARARTALSTDLANLKK